MTALFNDLQMLGLSPNQSQVYLVLVRLGAAKAGEIIKRTGMHRNLVYLALQELVEKKLISTSKSKKISVYKPLAPVRLLAEPQEKERIAKHVMEELALLSKRATSGQEIVVYEGVDEFRRYEQHLYASLKQGNTLRYLGISPQWHEIMGPSLEQELIGLQLGKNIKLKALANAVTHEQKEYVRRTRGLSEVRANPLVSSDTSGVAILEDRISIRSFVEPFFVVEILHEALAKNYQNYFDFLWKKSG